MSSRLPALAAFCLLLIGCVTNAPMEIDPDRGPIGKADAIGSCANSDCDGIAATGSCYCDEACSFYGDCCGDKVEVCDASPSNLCGGFAGFVCDPGEYCDFSQDAQCGAADGLGVCLELPQACTKNLAPVCGCDGQTYDNSCLANAAGTSVVHDGECGPAQCLGDGDCQGFGSVCDTSACGSDCAPGMLCPQVCLGVCQQAPTCGGFGGLLCPAGLECVADPDSSCDPANGGADCGGKCIEPEPSCAPSDCPGGGSFGETPLMACDGLITHGNCEADAQGACQWTCPAPSNPDL